jgi:CBS domain-containing protein
MTEMSDNESTGRESSCTDEVNAKMTVCFENTTPLFFCVNVAQTATDRSFVEECSMLHCATFFCMSDCPPPPSPVPASPVSASSGSALGTRRNRPQHLSVPASPSASPAKRMRLSTPSPSPAFAMSASAHSLESLWIKITIGELHGLHTSSGEPQTPTHQPPLLPRKLVTIPSTHTVAQACAVLAANAVLSAPVYDTVNQVYLGLFDWRDVGAAVVKAALEEQQVSVPHSPTIRSRGASPSATPPGAYPVLNNSAAKTVVESLSHLNAERVVDLSRKNPLYSVTRNSSMLHAMEFFGRGIHRLLIAEDSPEKCVGENAYTGVVSQSDAVRYLHSVLKYSKDPILTEMKQKTIREASIGSTSVVHIQGSKSVLEALQLMEESKVSSIALLGERNEIQGNLSTTDIKYIFRKKMLSSLKEPCSQFINSIRQRQGLDNAGKDRSPYFSVSWDSTIEVCIGKIVATRAHRLFIVEQRKPCGVISLSDILKYFTPKESLHLWHPKFVPAEEADELNATEDQD